MHFTLRLQVRARQGPQRFSFYHVAQPRASLTHSLAQAYIQTHSNIFLPRGASAGASLPPSLPQFKRCSGSETPGAARAAAVAAVPSASRAPRSVHGVHRCVCERRGGANTASAAHARSTSRPLGCRAALGGQGARARAALPSRWRTARVWRADAGYSAVPQRMSVRAGSPARIIRGDGDRQTTRQVLVLAHCVLRAGRRRSVIGR
ncbi:hypothetical protein DFH09DRAFT_1196123 [Mycena vulgaris]|nr:hypothetical protein DFH09DRAFT_1196123 [Mycena vulgaris]